MQDVLSRRFNQPVTLVGSGRTDTGVHARGQGAHFDVLLPPDLIPDNGQLSEHEAKIQYTLNRMLPRDVRLYRLEVAHVFQNQPNERRQVWHSMCTSKGKLYSYRFSTNHIVHPLERFTRTHLVEEIDISQLRRVLQYFVGTHEFRPFAGMIEQTTAKNMSKIKQQQNPKPEQGMDEIYFDEESEDVSEINTVRTIYRIDLVEESQIDGNYFQKGNYRIDFYLKGALYKMVRNIVGSAFEACKVKKQRYDEEVLVRLLHQIPSSYNVHLENFTQNETFKSKIIYTRRDNLAKPAPPEGLTLEWVFYDEEELKEVLQSA